MNQASYLQDFARDLYGLVQADNRAALAALRRGAGKPLGEVNEPYRYLGHWFAGGNRYREEACYLVACLFATHQISWLTDGQRPGPTNLGASFRRFANESDSASVERRFVALLNAHADDLPVHLRHAVALLKSKDVPIDWARLLRDVEGWSWDSRSVQRDWARAFWGDAGSSQDVPEADANATPAASASPTSD